VSNLTDSITFKG